MNTPTGVLSYDEVVQAAESTTWCDQDDAEFDTSTIFDIYGNANGVIEFDEFNNAVSHCWGGRRGVYSVLTPMTPP